MPVDDLHALKDDMNAFILGHGLARYYAYVGEDIQSVLWESANATESWKDFVELAKASGLHFVTMSDDELDKEDLEFLTERLQNSTAALDEELEEARLLKQHVGKIGFLQLGFSYHGTMFLWETSTPWYDRYQVLLEASDEFGSIILDERDSFGDEER